MKNHIKISDTVQLSFLTENDSSELFSVVDKNRAHLRNWLPWLDSTTSPTDSLEFIKSTITQTEEQNSPVYTIMVNSRISGMVGFHPIDTSNRCAELGYWLSEETQGEGIMSKCVIELINMAFINLNMHRLQVPAAIGNKKSRSIPERLGMNFEGIIREREWLYNKFVDHAMYSILESEFGCWQYNKTLGM